MNSLKGIVNFILVLIFFLLFLPPIFKLLADFYEPLIRELLGH